MQNVLDAVPNFHAYCTHSLAFERYAKLDRFEISHYAQYAEHKFMDGEWRESYQEDEVPINAFDDSPLLDMPAYQVDALFYKNGNETHKLTRILYTDCSIREGFDNVLTSRSFGRLFYPDGNVYIGWTQMQDWT